ncbi:hypothetical protein ACLOJK_006679 [Asimina triloba]
MAGRAPSQCLRPTTVTPPAAVPVAGRYTLPEKELRDDCNEVHRWLPTKLLIRNSARRCRHDNSSRVHWWYTSEPIRLNGADDEGKDDPSKIEARTTPSSLGFNRPLHRRSSIGDRSPAMHTLFPTFFISLPGYAKSHLEQCAIGHYMSPTYLP